MSAKPVGASGTGESGCSLPDPTLIASLVFEGDIQSDAIRGDLAVLDGDVHPVHFGDTQIAHRSGGGLDRGFGGGGPRVAAGSDDLGHAVDAIRHDQMLPSRWYSVSTSWVCHQGGALDPETSVGRART